MKCKKCNTDVLESFQFCHKCGEKLVVECSSRSGSNIDHSNVTECSEGCVSGQSLFQHHLSGYKKGGANSTY